MSTFFFGKQWMRVKVNRHRDALSACHFLTEYEILHKSQLYSVDSSLPKGGLGSERIAIPTEEFVRQIK